MSDTPQPQLYLLTPKSFELSQFTNDLQRVLDVADVACLRLTLSTEDEREMLKAGDALREIAHGRDIPLVIDTHVQMVERLGLDGVHLTDGGRGLRKLRDDFGPDPIIGAYCGTSRHDGLNAGEAGADYVSFGPISASAMGDGSVAEDALFAWWSDMIELPVVAEGGLTADHIARLAPITDFFALGAEIWQTEDPVAALKGLWSPLQGS